MSKIIVKPTDPSTILTPPVGFVTMFLSSLDNRYYLKFDTGLTEKLITETDLNGTIVPEIYMFNTLANFPVTGNINFVYIDKSSNLMYRWDDGLLIYSPIISYMVSVPYIRNQYSERFGENINVNTVEEALDTILFPYAQAAVSLTGSPSSQTREFGNPLLGISLDANVVRKTDPITAVQFFLNGGFIYAVPAPSPNSGVYNYVIPTPIDTPSTYTVKVDDGTNITTSNAITINFVYPYYFGSGVPGLGAVDIQALSKIIESQSNKTRAFSPTNQVFYFAYPASYPALTSIIDANGFETIDDWTANIVSFTMLDLTVQNFRVYEFNNLTTQVGFNITFKH